MGKRGPKAADGKREPNGRLSRKPPDIMKRLGRDFDKEQRETMRVGIEARNRVYGMSAERAPDQMAGSFAGRLCMSGEISQQQYEAARLYLETYHDMARSIGGPSQASALDPNAVRGVPGPENVDRSIKAMKAWESSLRAVQDRQNQLRGQGSLIAALDHCVLRDGEFTHMVGWLREALNALAKHYNVGDKMKPRPRTAYMTLTE